MKISISQSFQRILISGLPLPFRLADSPRKGIWNMSFSLNLGKWRGKTNLTHPVEGKTKRTHTPLSTLPCPQVEKEGLPCPGTEVQECSKT